MIVKLAVEFDDGLVGQKVFAELEDDYGDCNEKETDGRMRGVWNNPSDPLVQAVIEMFNEDDVILDIQLSKREE